MTGGHSYLLSANFGTGNIDVLKGDAATPDLAGKFVDPGLPTGYAPFNISKLGNTIYVTYALTNGKDDLPGSGHGIVTAFDENGTFLGRIGSHGDARLAVGVGDRAERVRFPCRGLAGGKLRRRAINVFSPDPNSTAFLGQLTDVKTGQALSIDGLWGLIPGNGSAPVTSMTSTSPRDQMASREECWVSFNPSRSRLPRSWR